MNMPQVGAGWSRRGVQILPPPGHFAPPSPPSHGTRFSNSQHWLWEREATHSPAPAPARFLIRSAVGDSLPRSLSHPYLTQIPSFRIDYRRINRGEEILDETDKRGP